MAGKRKTLPKDFEALLAEGDIDRLKAVFEGCSLDARGGSFKRSALAFAACPVELMRWLVEQGADLHAADRYGETPLHSHAGSWNGQVELMIALGADVDHGTGQANGTPLHRAARSAHPQNVAPLLAAGARADAPDGQGWTPLDLCLLYCSNADLERAAAVATLLLQAGAQPTPGCQDAVTRIGERFEFHRAGFNSDRLDRASEALDRLYALFGVAPVPKRTMHDGVSPIVMTAARWEDRLDELWQMLVPSSGAARTIQGEVIRLAGKIARELDGNGGANWDAEYRRMVDAWLAHVGSGTPLGDSEMMEARQLVREAKARGGDMERLGALAVAWVDRNPDPVPLPTPPYER